MISQKLRDELCHDIQNIQSEIEKCHPISDRINPHKLREDFHRHLNELLSKITTQILYSDVNVFKVKNMRDAFDLVNVRTASFMAEAADIMEDHMPNNNSVYDALDRLEKEIKILEDK